MKLTWYLTSEEIEQLLRDVSPIRDAFTIDEVEFDYSADAIAIGLDLSERDWNVVSHRGGELGEFFV